MSELIERHDAIDAIVKQSVVDKTVAKRVLAQLPSAEPQVRTYVSLADCVSKQAAINALENTDVELSSKEWDELAGAIMGVPSEEPGLELEELKIVADKFGYRLVKKAEKVKLLPCSCGCKKKPTEWVKASNGSSGWFYKCDICNKKSEVVDTKIGAKRAWNRMILEQGEWLT